MRRWMLWFPVLMIGSLVYWTLALSLGGLSLFALSTLGTSHRGIHTGHCHEHEPRIAGPVLPDESPAPIVVHLQSEDDEDEGEMIEAVEAFPAADDADDVTAGMLPKTRARGAGGAETIRVELRADPGGKTAF